MINKIGYFLLAILLVFRLNISLAAEGGDPAPLSKNQKANSDKPKLTPEQRRFILRRQMIIDPKNFDAYFAYAQLSTMTGKLEDAEKAYNYMLKLNPKLTRVKLELALLYMKMNKLEESKKLFEYVLSTNPPDKVKGNITKMLKIVDNALKKHLFAGSLTAGLNHDYNANSAASTGETTFSDVSIPLGNNSRIAEDMQSYMAASLKHTYKIGALADFANATYDSSVTLYRTEQRDLESLNIMLYAFKTGPVFTFKDYNLKVNPNISYNSISVENTQILGNKGADIVFTYVKNPKLSFTFTPSYEKRKYMNTPENSTFVLRTGEAYQYIVGTTFALSDKDIISLNGTIRHEQTQVVYNDNVQRSVTATYVHAFPMDISTSLVLGFKKAHYNGPDASVSASMIRNDRERSATFTVSKKFPHNINFSLGYQYKNATSNIQNFDYVNHRISSALGWSF